MMNLADAYALFHSGSIALARMEANGIKVHTEYLDQAIKDVTKKINDLTADIKQTKFFGKWRKRFGEKTNLGSREQLGTVLVEDGFKLPETASSNHKKRRYATDEDNLRETGSEFALKFLEIEKLKKARGTYLENLKSETIDGYIHPVPNLHTVNTGRSSYSDPNLQNMPIRDAGIGEIIRRAIIPRKGHRLVEIDYGALEFKIAACVWADPDLIKYASDPDKDVHRDMASWCYCLKIGDVSKEARFYAKNQFVFPTIYGSYFKQTAKNLWEAMIKTEMKSKSGRLVKDILKEKGITKLGKCKPGEDAIKGTFEHHIKMMEEKFMRLFPKFAKDKETLYEQYRKEAGFTMPTGFRCDGLYTKNFLLNARIQGCLAGTSKVLTDKGLIPIEELIGKNVKVWTGFKWADAIGINKGEYQRAIINLSSGLKVKCDTRHKLKNEKNQWIDFDKLKEGDYVALPKINDAILPSTEMNWWFIFGFIIGDGCISGNRNRKSLSICVGEKKLPILENIYNFLIEQGHKEGGYRGIHWKIIPPKNNKKQKYQLMTQNKNFATFLEKHGFVFGWKSKTKRIPKSVWTATIQQQRDFMEGLWLSDGNRTPNRCLNSPNKILLREVQILTSQLGFDSQKTDTTHLRFNVHRELSQSPRKYPAAALLRQAPKFVFANYKKKSMGKNNYLNSCEGISDKRNYHQAEKGQPIAQRIAERIIQHNSKNPEVYRYDKIISIEILDKIETTYTMAVDDDLHQFVADGVIHKNSAFHCLLWSIIEIQKELDRREMESLPICEIHDCILSSCPDDELQDYINLSVNIMTKKIRKAWNWIVVPLIAEVDVTPINGSWHEKAPWMKHDNGIWGPKK